MAETTPPKSLKTSIWVFTTYFTEGLPYMIVRFMSSAFFTDLGVREAYLGFLNFLGIPWNLKFLWAPFLDIFGTKKNWLIKTQAAITVLVLVLAVMAGLPAEPSPHGILWLIAFLFIAAAFIAATNDIAIDAYYLEMLTRKEDQAAYTGLRSLAYRIAVIYARSVLVGLAGLFNWFWGFGAGALTMLAFLILHAFILPQPETLKERKSLTFSEVKNNFTQSFVSYLRQEKVGLVLLFVATYKLGDEILFSMNTPFLMREMGVTKTQLAWLAGFVASFSTIFGTWLAAWWIKKKTLKKAIWPITLLMNINILAYLILSEGPFRASDAVGLTVIAVVHGYENIASGLGSAALMVYLMRLCKPQYKAAHYAVGSAIMSLGSTFIGGFGGVIVEKVGYTNLFLLSFSVTLPLMLLLFWIPLHENDGDASSSL